MSISRAGQLLAQPAHPMHLRASKIGRPRKPSGTGFAAAGYGSVTRPADRQMTVSFSLLKTEMAAPR